MKETSEFGKSCDGSRQVVHEGAFVFADWMRANVCEQTESHSTAALSV
jgi:hypothetical protein